MSTNILKLTSTKLERKKKPLTSTITYHMRSRVHIQNRPTIQKMIFLANLLYLNGLKMCFLFLLLLQKSLKLLA